MNEDSATNPGTACTVYHRVALDLPTNNHVTIEATVCSAYQIISVLMRLTSRLTCLQRRNQGRLLLQEKIATFASPGRAIMVSELTLDGP